MHHLPVVSDSMNFVFPSSPIVPNAVAAKFILSCSFVVFLILVNDGIYNLPFVKLLLLSNLLKSSSVFWDQMPVPSLTCPVFHRSVSWISAIVPSARRVVTSLIASLTLSRYMPRRQIRFSAIEIFFRRIPSLRKFPGIFRDIVSQFIGFIQSLLCTCHQIIHGICS